MDEKIKNKGNWFVVEIIETAEPVRTKKTNPLRRRAVWSNMHLVKAKTADRAYQKGLLIGRNLNYRFINSDKIEMESKFIGIGDLIPVYDDIEDGCEILWEDHGFISARRSQSFVRSKKELLTCLEVNSKQKQNNRTLKR